MAVNNWTGYFQRTYDQIKGSVLAQLSAAAPEITDQSAGNPLIRGIEVWAGIAEWIHYYIDNNAKETFLAAARRYPSGVAAARFNNYRIHNASPASAVIIFYITTAQSTDIVIPKNTKVTTVDGNIDFYTTADITLLTGQTRVSANVIQLSPTVQNITVVATGQAGQAFKIDNQIADGFVSVVVNNINWRSVDNFIFSSGADAAFMQNVSYSGDAIIMFGDGYRGGVPSINQNILISYQTTLGTLGNVNANTINTIPNAITSPVPISVLNPLAASGGSDIETLSSLKRNVPSVRRTQMRAVTKTDYKAITEMVAGVSRAAIDNQCGNVITVYIVPSGGGLATPTLIQQVTNFLDDKKVLGRSINVVSAGIVRILFEIVLKVKNGYSNTDVSNTVIANLTAFLSFENQEIGGTVYKSDIYQTIEDTIGVDNSDIVKMTTVPYARPTYLPSVLDWVVQTLPTSVATVKWELKFVVQQLGVSRFQLYKNGNYKGTFSSNVEVVFLEVRFTILENYANGYSWEFYTYKYSENLILTEMSLPVALASDIIITYR